jgi:hypothetical protein
MSDVTQEEQPKKVHNSNSPWRKPWFIRTEVSKWAKEQAYSPEPVNYKKGGGKPQK